MRERIKAVAKKRYEEAIKLPDMILNLPLNLSQDDYTETFDVK